MLALIPGVSRSGASTSAGLALGYARPAAARYSFLLAVPAVFGSGLYESYTASPRARRRMRRTDARDRRGDRRRVRGRLAVIAFLMRYISTRSFLPFVIYRILLGSVLIVLLSLGILQP